jgi:mitochondrial fission protein ELM1
MMTEEHADIVAQAAHAHGVAGPSLAGARAWIISDGRAGHLAITLGIARALGVNAEIKPVAARLPYRMAAPWGPADPRLLGNLLAQPWPAIALGAGRQTVPVIRALKRQTGGRIFTVLGQDPKTGAGSADLIWVPEHDALRGASVVATLTPPHRFRVEDLRRLREQQPGLAAARTVALFLGGPGGGYDWPAAEIDRFAECLRAIAAQGPGFLITPSRRTPPALLAAADAITAGSPRILWTGEGENPYATFLAQADAFIVTADSVNMAGEASVTGRPIHVFHPRGGRTKFRRYHAALESHGAARPLTPATDISAAWTYEPLDAARIVAAEIERRWCMTHTTSCAREG